MARTATDGRRGQATARRRTTAPRDGGRRGTGDTEVRSALRGLGEAADRELRRRTGTSDPEGATAPAEPAPASGRRRRGRGLGALPAAIAERAVGLVAEELQRRIPVANLDDRDPDYIRESLPGLWMLASFYFRADVRGLQNIPADGPVLMVGNHSGGNVTPDTLVLTLAFSTYFGVERRMFQLAHNLVTAWPVVGPLLRRYGTVTASHENARRALRSGAALLVYPGGDYEVHRPSWESARVDFDGRTGFIRLALEEDVPIVPVVAIGGQETALFLSRGERLARLLRLDRALRLKVLPVSLALPWGLNVGDFMSHIPLPAKITIQVLPPIDLRARFGPHPDVDEVYRHVVGTMQRTLDALAAERRFPVLG